jgi:flagellar hook-associated protein 3 FlgL
MRVSTNSFPNAMVDQLHLLAGRQYRLQHQAATGQKLASPDENPLAVRRVLDLQGELRALGQYQSNIAQMSEMASRSFDSIKALKKVSDRAGEIAVLADDLKSPQQLRVFAQEVTEMIKQAVQMANASHRGEYIFAGTRSDAPPFEIDADAEGKILAVNYRGNATVPENEIDAGVTASARVPGENSSGSGAPGLLSDSRSGADFFKHLISLQNNLLAGDTAAIASTDRPQLARDEENFIFHLGQNGVLQARLETSAAFARGRSLSAENSISREADADLAETLVRLNQTQNAYRAALQAGGTLLDRSLLDFLR